MAGVFLILLGLFRLGTIIKFIPYPIVVGFTSGIAVTIFTTQIKDLFGLTTPKCRATSPGSGWSTSRISGRSTSGQRP